MRGKRSIGKGFFGREEGGRGVTLLPSPSLAVSRPNSLPPSNACHAGTGYMFTLRVFFTVDQSPNYLLCDMIIVKQFRYFVQYISCGVSIQVKAFKQCFPVVLFIMLYFELIEGPVRNKKNFVCFAKKSVNRKPFLVRTIFPPTKIFSAVIKVQSCRREDLEAYNFLSGDKNPLFLDSYPSSGHSKR